MSIVVITNEDLGTGLKIESNKVVVDRDALSIPVDVKLAGVQVDKQAQTMKFTLSDGSEITQNIADFLAVDTDTKIVSGSYADNKITLVPSEGDNIEINLAAFATAVKDAAVAEAGTAADQKVAAAVEAAKQEQAAKDQAQDAKIQALEAQAATKPAGIEVQSLAGTTLGYLVPASAVTI